MLSTKGLADFLFAMSNFMATPIEKEFQSGPIQIWIGQNWHVPIGCLVAYLIFISLGQVVMKQYKPFDLRYPLAAWNALLSIFSFIGMFRTVPYLLGELLTMTFEQTVCTYPKFAYGEGPCGFWVALFILSKIPELIDTVFIVLRKRDLIFLHWYHHVTVLLYCWHAYATAAGSGIYFVAMNYSVHALMYGYFCLQALKMVPKSFPAILITLSQIAQMFVGTGVCVSCWYFHVSGRECANDLYNLIAGGLMYGSYLYLFVEFAFGRFSPDKEKKTKPKKA